MPFTFPSFLRQRALPLLALPATLLLGGCNMIVLHPHGDVARQQAGLVVQSTLLMLLIIVPVIALTLFFAFRYRASNKDAEYTPDWDHSTRLELIIWGAPLLIIIALGAITWISTHKLDPYRALDHIDAQRSIPANVKPLVVDVVALDWKWLFIYPEQGIAVVNELAAPVDRPIEFRITASNVMNAFYIPELAGMVYAMPGMETQLHGVINRPGNYEGMSSNYSGAGFSDMHFRFLGMSDADFARWVDSNKAGGQALTRDVYGRLEQPSQKNPVTRYASVDGKLFDAIVNRCADGKSMCVRDMMAVDMQGGAGKGAVSGLTQKQWGDRQRTVVAAMCTPANPDGLPQQRAAD